MLDPKGIMEAPEVLDLAPDGLPQIKIVAPGGQTPPGPKSEAIYEALEIRAHGNGQNTNLQNLQKSKHFGPRGGLHGPWEGPIHKRAYSVLSELRETPSCPSTLRPIPYTPTGPIGEDHPRDPLRVPILDVPPARDITWRKRRETRPPDKCAIPHP